MTWNVTAVRRTAATIALLGAFTAAAPAEAHHSSCGDNLGINLHEGLSPDLRIRLFNFGCTPDEVYADEPSGVSSTADPTPATPARSAKRSRRCRKAIRANKRSQRAKRCRRAGVKARSAT